MKWSPWKRLIVLLLVSKFPTPKLYLLLPIPKLTEVPIDGLNTFFLNSSQYFHIFDFFIQTNLSQKQT